MLLENPLKKNNYKVKVGNQLTTYPNPAGEEFDLEYHLAIKDATVKIINIWGVMVTFFKMSSSTGVLTISTGDFLPGMYNIVAVKDDEILANSRIAIQQ